MLTIHCLGNLQSITGHSDVQIEWPHDSSIETALTALTATYPTLANELPRCACAIGDRLVPRSHQLQSGDELVLLPPVGGG